MYTLDIFDQFIGFEPFVLFDGRGIILGLPFFIYIDDPAHTWVCCFDVPYGYLFGRSNTWQNKRIRVKLY